MFWGCFQIETQFGNKVTSHWKGGGLGGVSQ